MTMPEQVAPPPASLRLRIDHAAIAANWRMLDRLSHGARAGAAVKADAYGVGVDHAVPALLAAGARSTACRAPRARARRLRPTPMACRSPARSRRCARRAAKIGSSRTGA
ncbi:MAG TPA: alanine racemase, partial [Paracoccaceae bacterium]|nr:alanine racemase [Paracoccaceae bacterium]